MAEKVTKMLIKVDLQCWRCYEKIKKILRKIPHPRKIIYKGRRRGGAGVEIPGRAAKEPEKPKDTKKPKVVIIEPPKKTAKLPAPPIITQPPPDRTYSSHGASIARNKHHSACLVLHCLDQTCSSKASAAGTRAAVLEGAKAGGGLRASAGVSSGVEKASDGAMKDVGDQPMRVKVKVEVALLWVGEQNVDKGGFAVLALLQEDQENSLPEKIRQKIICEGSETVQSIENLPDKDTKKPKKVRFIEPPKETAKPPAPVPVPALPRKAPKPTPPKAPQQAPALPLPKASKPVVGYLPVPGYPVVWRRPVIGAVMDVGDQPTRVNVKIEVAILGRGGQ
ncbi:hypothetical protein NL676_007650 [Syzygium grande]|nr:hypothetical protein NL676_007650 [Syzygium grande]